MLLTLLSIWSAVKAFFGGMFEKIKWIVLAFIGLCAIVLAVFLKGRSSGKAEVVAQEREQRINAIEERKKTDAAVESADPGQLDLGLDKWMRD